MIQGRLRSLAWIGTFGSIGAGAALVAACSGKVSNGTLTSTAQPVSISDVSATAGACPSGSAHPNVCCEGGADQAASCVVYPNAPFTQCANGTTTYPDPRTCCPLDGNGACATPPQTLPSDAGAGSGDTCVYACPVGWYSPPDSSGTSSGGPGGTTCCQASSDGSGVCMASAGASGGGCTCACPSCDTDGSCPPCPPCNCPEQPSTPSCNACPPGWQTPQGEPLLCCTEQPDGTIACFSQGVPPPPPGEQVDAGVTAPATCMGGGGGGSDGSTFTQCGCSETVGGTNYSVTCSSSDDASGTCTCSESTGSGGSGVGTEIPQPASACDDVGALFSACGFPSAVSGGSSSTGTGSAGGSSSGG